MPETATPSIDAQDTGAWPFPFAEPGRSAFSRCHWLAGRRLARPWWPASRSAQWRQQDRALAAGLTVLRDLARHAGPGLTGAGSRDAGSP